MIMTIVVVVIMLPSIMKKINLEVRNFYLGYHTIKFYIVLIRKPSKHLKEFISTCF